MSGSHRVGRPAMAAILLFTVFVAAGCGYTTRSSISNKYKTIRVFPFANKIDITQEESYIGSKYKIYKPLLESDITRAVKNRYLLDGNLKPVDRDTADLFLKGELIDFRREPLRYTDSDDVAEYRIDVVVNITLHDKEDKLVWEESHFTGEFSYFTQGPAAKPESTAITEAISDLARRIVERTVEQW